MSSAPLIPRDQVNILVVDDLSDKLLAVKTALEDLGENVVCVQSGREALRRVIDHDFAVILLDVNMPDMNGLETAQLIRGREKSRHTPIIFITAFPDDVAEVEVYSLGAVDYIMSPVVPQILRSKVSVFVDLHRKREHIRRQADERVQLAREQVARQAAEEAQKRAQFLAETSAVLSQSLDLEETLRSVAGALVPALAGDAVVALSLDPGAPGPVVRATQREDGGSDVAMLTSLDALELATAANIRRVGASARGEMLGGEERGPFPGMVVPIALRERILGAMALSRPRSSGGFRLEDRVMAEELAARAAHAIDNARLYRDIQESDRRKNEFLAMLAHELRNPLAPIAAAVEIVKVSENDRARTVASCDVIARQVRQLSRLVDDLLDVARITTGKIRLEAQLVDVEDIVSQAVESIRPLIEQRRQRLQLRLPDAAERLMVEGDHTRLSQVLGNLLHNATKYTPEGGEIVLTAEGRGEDVVIGVRDTGIGVAREMLPVIFDLFTQVDRALDRAQGGLGIGLTLVRRLIELHGGSVEATSPGLGKGTELVVRLPRITAMTDDKNQAAQAPHPTPDARPAQVLVVDDNEDAAEMLAELLRLVGHDVLVCHDGRTGLSMAEEHKPEFALLDVGLPEIDGYEIARRIRAQPALDDMILVAITGYGQESDKQRSRAAGFNHHLVKPVNPDVLAAILAQHKAALARAAST